MHFIFIISAWFTPAIIAGALGWTGVWGGTNAFFDYIIPIPVAGGAFHVPSFLVATVVMLGLRKKETITNSLIPVFAIGVFLAAQTMQLDFERLNSALFTDYEPHGSIFRFESNPVFLFIATDAFWVAAFAFYSRYTVKIKYLVLVALVPVVVIAYQTTQYQTSEPQFKHGFSSHMEIRGDQVTYIYTTHPFDRERFMKWLINDSSVAMPWYSPNFEHLAVYFTTSMQAIEWRDVDSMDNIIGTICVYEEDMYMEPYGGYVDCFAQLPNVQERIDTYINEINTGFGKTIDSWLARAMICKNYTLPDQISSALALENHCRLLQRDYQSTLNLLRSEYGEGSEQVNFINDKVLELNLPIEVKITEVTD